MLAKRPTQLPGWAARGISMQWDKEQWRRMIKKHGAIKVWAGLLTIPIWMPIYFTVRWIAALCVAIGDFGYWLEGRL